MKVSRLRPLLRNPGEAAQVRAAKGAGAGWRWRRLWFNTEGSYTLEATLIMPIVFLCTIGLLLFSYLIYDNSMLGIEAQETAERGAYVWSDSSKDPVTGAFSYEQLDGIYGSMMLESLGAISSLWSGAPQAAVSTDGEDNRGPASSRNKLNRLLGLVPAGTDALVEYRSRLLQGEITARLTKPAYRFGLPDWLIPNGRVPRAEASSFTADPVGFVRNVDLLAFYLGKWKDKLSRKEAEQLVQEAAPPAPKREPIRSHEEALAFLKTIVSGTSQRVETSLGWRTLDIVDRDGVVHEAKYYVNKKDAAKQIEKDAELIRSGKVRGVIWHFFPIEKTGKPDLTESLRRMLDQNGILYIVHQA